MLRYKTETRPDLVALYDIRPGNGAGPFLQPRSPHRAKPKIDMSKGCGGYSSSPTLEAFQLKTEGKEDDETLLNVLFNLQKNTKVSGKRSLVTGPLTILDSSAFTTLEVAADWHWL